MINVVGNVIKFMEIGVVMVNVWLDDDIYDLVKFSFEIVDMGIGILVEMIEKIFILFM